MEIRKGRSVGSTGDGNLEGGGQGRLLQELCCLAGNESGDSIWGMRGKRRSADSLLGFPNLVIIFGK